MVKAPSLSVARAAILIFRNYLPYSVVIKPLFFGKW